MRPTGSLLSKFKYWKRYVELETFTGNRKWRPVRGWTWVDRRPWYYTENRPWTDAAKEDQLKKMAKVLVEPIKDWVWYKGDRVEVLVGRDKGKQGIINSIIRERNWCFVEGLHCKYDTAFQYPGLPGIMTKSEQPLIVNRDIALVDPSDNKPTPVEFRYTHDGNKVRVSTRTGRIVPYPKQSHELEDFILPSTYAEQPKDTPHNVVKKLTFEPKLKTFEEDIMDEMGIVETRKRTKTYWY